MRINELDILKGIGIILVVLGHTGISGLPYIYIYTFHMPLFFFISGCFFKNIKLSSMLAKRVQTLLIPYISFSFLFLIGYTIVGCFDGSSIMDSFFRVLSTFNLLDEDCKYLYRTIWFLLCLFEINIMYALLSKLSRIYKTLGVLVCWILGAYLRGIDIPIFLDSALSCILYYHIGYEFFSLGFYKRDISKAIPWFVLILLSVAIVILLPNVNLSRNEYPLYLPLLALAYIINLYYLIKAILSVMPSFIDKILTILGKDTLLILGFHRFYFIIFETLFPLIGLGGLISCGIKFIIVFPLIYLIKKTIVTYCPVFVGKAKILNR